MKGEEEEEKEERLEGIEAMTNTAVILIFVNLAWTVYMFLYVVEIAKILEPCLREY